MKEINTKTAVKDWRYGKILRDLREFTRRTQTDIAKWIGVSTSMVSQIERGVATMTIEQIEKVVARFDGITVENFTENKPITWSRVH